MRIRRGRCVLLFKLVFVVLVRFFVSRSRVYAREFFCWVLRALCYYGRFYELLVSG